MEKAEKVFGVVVAHGPGNLVDLPVGGGQQFTGLFDPHVVEIIDKFPAGLAAEQLADIAAVHIKQRREKVLGQVILVIAPDIGADAVDGLGLVVNAFGGNHLRHVQEKLQVILPYLRQRVEGADDGLHVVGSRRRRVLRNVQIIV